ncbi:MAG: SMP-30/gluconolactonase/LRE family protein [Pseudomonadota bacterium]
MLETLAWGYGLLEGPRFDADGSLYFCDASEGGVYRRAPDGTMATIVPKRKAVGGIALHADGGIVISGRDISHVRGGESRVIFKCSAPSLNDIFVDAQGCLIVGTVQGAHVSRDNRVPGECLRIDRSGKATELYNGILLTNGIGLSPGNTVLYHADTGGRCLIAHDYSADGKVSNKRLLVQGEGFVPDGLAVDEAGTIWVADLSGSQAIRGFAADGREVGRIAVPARRPTSLCFGGHDRRDMYIVTADNTDMPDRRGTIFRTRVDVPGCAVQHAAV